MSKAFTKDDSDDGPLVVPSRAPLPAGAVNHVTARGLTLLREELERLQGAGGRGHETDERERRRASALRAARVAELEARLATAVLVDPTMQPHDEIRFGAVATIRTASGEERRFRIVGVDESDVSNGLVAFAAPLARALLGRRVGEVTTVRTPRGAEEVEIVAISYET